MVSEQIYINGKAVDMPARSVQLSMRSNLLGKVSELTASFSYTITLPRTLNNDQMLAQSWSITSESSGKGIHLWLPCTFERDGVQMFSGRLVVTSINEDGYNCNMVWGFAGLDEMTEQKLKLWQLGVGQNDWVRLSGAPAIDQRNEFYGQPHFGFAEYYTGVADSEAYKIGQPRILPSVSVRYILAQIKSKYGVTLDLPTEEDAEVDNMVVALTSRYLYRGEDYPQASFLLDVDNTEGEMGQKIWFYRWREWSNRGIVIKEGDNVWMTTAKGKVKNLHIGLSCNEQFYISCPALHDGAITATRLGNRYVIDYTLNDVEVEQDRNIMWTIAVDNDTPNHTWMASLQLADYAFTYIPDKNEVTINSGYPIMANLPDLTCMEFIGELCMLLGVVPIASTDKVINCIKWASLLDDPQELQCVGIDEMLTRIDKMAQRNILTYATDDGNTDGAEGELLVDDATLQAEETWHKSHFATMTLNRGIEMYKVTTDSEGALSSETNSITERIAVMVEYLTTATLTGEGMQWNNIVTSKYAEMQKAITHPKVVTIKANMTPSEFAGLDLKRAVYIKQLASYFAVLEVESGEGDIYDIKLLKI